MEWFKPDGQSEWPYIPKQLLEIMMLVGVPKEIKTREFRVGLVPSSVAELVHRGHQGGC